MQQALYLVHGARTPFAKFKGSFRDVTTLELAVNAGRAALERARVSASEIDNVVFGCVHQASHTDGILLARHVALRVGADIACPALTVNRLCGSGMQALVSAAQAMLLGESKVALVGGAENMTQVPFVLRGLREGLELGTGRLEDLLWESLLDSHAGCTMADTAENVGRAYHLTREDVDAFAALSHSRALQAQAQGFLAEEITPVAVADRKGTRLVTEDEIPRPTTAETLAKLPPRFHQDGLVTAGNASALSDGAAAGVLATEEYVARHGLQPLGRLVSWGIVGVEPRLMGLGPVPAIQAALRKAQLSLSQMDLIEINEAFAAQFLGCQRELGFDLAQANVNGGAIALGHPLGASGMRLILTLLFELRRRRARYGVAALCIGGGQGIATVWESV